MYAKNPKSNQVFLMNTLVVLMHTMQTTKRINHFLQMRLIKPNLCYIAWSRQQEAFVST